MNTISKIIGMSMLYVSTLIADPSAAINDYNSTKQTQKCNKNINEYNPAVKQQPTNYLKLDLIKDTNVKANKNSKIELILDSKDNTVYLDKKQKNVDYGLSLKLNTKDDYKTTVKYQKPNATLTAYVKFNF